jgi:hypothetical protein
MNRRKALGPGDDTTLGLYQAARGRLLGTGGELFWHSLVVSRTKYGWLAALLLALGVVQVLRGRLLPPASSLIVCAIHAHKALATARDVFAFWPTERVATASAMTLHGP